MEGGDLIGGVLFSSQLRIVWLKDGQLCHTDGNGGDLVQVNMPIKPVTAASIEEVPEMGPEPVLVASDGRFRFATDGLVIKAVPVTPAP